MSEDTMIGEASVGDDNRSDWDIDGMTEDLFSELNGTIPRSTIESTLRSLFASYDDAAVKAFLPVIIRRLAFDLLYERI